MKTIEIESAKPLATLSACLIATAAGESESATGPRALKVGRRTDEQTTDGLEEDDEPRHWVEADEEAERGAHDGVVPVLHRVVQVDRKSVV